MATVNHDRQSGPHTARKVALLAGWAVSVASASAMGEPEQANWIEAVSGSWFDTSRWDGGVVPNNGLPGVDDEYEAIIAATGSPFTITIDQDLRLTRLVLDSADATLRLTSSLLQIDDAFEIQQGQFSLLMGEITGGTINIAPLATFTVAGSGISRISGSIVNGDLRVGGFGTTNTSTLEIGAGTELNGSVLLGRQNTPSNARRERGIIRFDADHTLNGSIVFETNGSSTLGQVQIAGDRTLSIDANGTIVGAGSISRAATFQTSLVNDGLILANASGLTLSIDEGVRVSNAGRMEAIDGGRLLVTDRLENAGILASCGENSVLEITDLRGSLGTVSIFDGGLLDIRGGSYAVNQNQSLDGGTLRLRGEWSGTGAFTLQNGALLDLGGSFSTGSLQIASRSEDSSVVLSNAFLDNGGATLALGSALGDLQVFNSTIVGGAIDVLLGRTLRIDGSSSTIDGSTIAGDVLVQRRFTTSSSRLRLEGDSIVDGFVELARRQSFSGTNKDRGEGYITIAGDTLVNGQIDVSTDGNSTTGGITIESGRILTVSETGAITGPSFFSRSGAFNARLINDGLISSDRNGFEMRMNSGVEVINTGTIQAVGGGDVRIFDRLDNDGELRAVGAASLLEIDDLRGSLGTISLEGDGRIQVDGGFYTVDRNQILQNGRLTLAGLYDIDAGITVSQDSFLTLNGTWSSSGMITLDGSQLTLGGSFTTAGLGTIVRNGDSRLVFSGTLDNRGAVLNAPSVLGVIQGGSGTILGGTVSASNGQAFELGIGTLTADGVDFDGDIRVQALGTTSATTLRLVGDTSVNGDIFLGQANSVGNTTNNRGAGYLTIDGATTLNGDLVFDRSGNSSQPSVSLLDGSELVLSAESTVGGPGSFFMSGSGQSRVTNHGIITSDLNNTTMSFSAGVELFNQGELRAIGGGDIAIDRLTGSLGPALVIGNGSRLTVTSGEFAAAEPISVLAGGFLDVNGVAGSVGAITVQDASDARLTGNFTLGSQAIVANGSFLTLDGSWRNEGSITLLESQLIADGQFSTTDLGDIVSIGNSRVRIEGVMDNSGATLRLDASSPMWTLDGGGEIRGGSIVSLDGRSFEVADFGFGSTIDGYLTDVSVSGSVLVGGTGTTGTARLVVLGGTAFLDGITIGRANSVARIEDQRGWGILRFDDDHTLASSIEFETAGNSSLGQLEIQGGRTLTVSATGDIRGAGTITRIGTENAMLDIQGLLSADSSGLTMTVNSSVDVLNSGTLAAVNGGILRLLGTTQNSGVFAANGDGSLLEIDDLQGDLGGIAISDGGEIRIDGGIYSNAADLFIDNGLLTFGGDWTNTGSISLNDAQLTLSGTYKTSDIGIVQRTGDSRVLLSGSLDNRGDTIDISAVTGSFEGASLSMTGGSIATADGERLTLVSGGSTFSDVAIDGEVAVRSSSLTIEGDGGLAGTLLIGRRNSDFSNGSVSIVDDLVVDGSIIMETEGFSTLGSMSIASGRTLAVSESGLLVGAGTISRNGSPLPAFIDNAGVIRADAIGTLLDISNGVVVHNTGVLESISGGEFRIRDELLNSGTLRAVGASSLLELDDLRGSLGTVVTEDGGHIRVDGGSFVVDQAQQINGGSLSLTGFYGIDADVTVSNGGTLTLDGAWQNSGLITLEDSFLDLNGSVQTDDFGTIISQGSSRTTLRGSLNNTNRTLVLDNIFGSLDLAGDGRIRGGSIQTSAGRVLRVRDDGGSTIDGTLNDVAVTGAVVVGSSETTADARLVIEGSTSFTGAVVLGRRTNFTGTEDDRGRGILRFAGDHTLNASVVFDTAGESTLGAVELTGGRTLTLGASGLLAGAGFVNHLGGSVSTIQNGGTISANADQLRLDIGSNIEVINTGTLQAVSGGELAFNDRLVNNGLVTAIGDGSEVVLPTQDLVTNAGLFRVVDGGAITFGSFETARLGALETDGGIFRLLNGTVENTGSQLNVVGTSGQFELSNGRITGGGVQLTDGVVLTANGSSGNRLSGVLFDGAVMLNDVSDLRLDGGTTLFGPVTFDERGTLIVTTDQSATLADDVRFLSEGSTSSLSLQSGATIALSEEASVSGGRGGFFGAGMSSSTIVNSGTILADRMGQTLDLSSLTLINNGAIEARDGGFLTLGSVTLTNSDGTVFADDGSTITFNNSLINGGSFDPMGSGEVILNSTTIDGSFFGGGVTRMFGGTLRDIVNNGTILAASSTDTTLAGTITNNGVLSFTNDGNFHDYFVSNATLAGTGEMVFQQVNDRVNGSGTGNSTLVNGVDHTIRGTGSINSLTLINNGTIRAENGTLTLSSIDLSNGSGTYSAITGATLSINSSILTGGVFDPEGDGTISFSSGMISDSVRRGEGLVTFSSTNVADTTFEGTGESRFFSGSLTDVTNNGLITAASSSDTTLAGTITNNGVLSFTNDGNFHDYFVLNATLAGTGEMVFQQVNDRVNGSGTGNSTLVNGVDHTIRGTGSINSLSLDNRGTVRAENGTLSLSGTTLVNSGTVEARSGTLNISSASNFAGGTLTGGTWIASDGGVIGFGGQITANDADVRLIGTGSRFDAINTIATNAGSFTVAGDRIFDTLGSLANDGDMLIGYGSRINVAQDYSSTAVSNLTFEIGDLVGGDQTLPGHTGSAPLGPDGQWGPGSHGGGGMTIADLSRVGLGTTGMLNIDGAAVFDGLLEIVLADDFVPDVAFEMTLITYSSFSGAFADVLFPMFPGDGFEWYSDARATEFVIGLSLVGPIPGSPVPAPGSLVPVALGAGLCSMRRRHRARNKPIGALWASTNACERSVL